jgi:hypothetical protein
LEWDVFTAMTFLNPSLQWIAGRSCSDERFERIVHALTPWVEKELSLEAQQQTADPCLHLIA